MALNLVFRGQRCPSEMRIKSTRQFSNAEDLGASRAIKVLVKTIRSRVQKGD